MKQKLAQIIAILSVLLVILLPAYLCYSRTWHVPSEVATIPDAVDSASYGDTVLVAPGTYICPDNTDCSYEWVLLPSGVSLLASGGADFTTIIDQTATMEPHEVISMSDAQDCLVKGFSLVRQSDRVGYFHGVGMANTSDSFIDSCRFDSFGYGVWVQGQTTHAYTPHIRWCYFTGCAIGIQCDVQPFYCPLIRYNTFDRCSWGVSCVNSGPYLADNYIANCRRSGVWCVGQSPACLDRNVIVNNGQHGLYVQTDVYAEPYLTTGWLPENGNSIYGNAEYDLYNAVEDQRGVVEARCTYWGSDCPDFEQVIGGPGRVNYLPWCDSTHTEEYVQCPPQPTLPSTWGSIKEMFR
jgi:hypothetical protein